jgi:hypothetical protein
MEWTTNGLEITLSPAGRFRVEGIDTRDYPSLIDAQEGARAQAKKNALQPMNLAVLLPDGKAAMLVGIHGNTGQWKFLDGKDRLFQVLSDQPPKSVFYPCDRAAALIAERNALEAEVTVRTQELEAYEIGLGRIWGRPDADRIVYAHESVQARYDELAGS